MLRIISTISTVILIINCIIYLKSFSSRARAFKVFSIYLLTISIIQVSSLIIGRLGIENIVFSHFYFITQFILLLIFYKLLLRGRIIKRTIELTILAVSLLLIIHFIYDYLILFKFSLIEIMSCSIPIIVYSAIHLFQSLDNKDKSYLLISSGVFVYILCSTLIFASGNLMPDLDPSINELIWNVNSYLYLTYQILIFIEWYKNFRKIEASAK